MGRSKAGAFLAQSRRRQVDSDALVIRIAETGVDESGFDALPVLPEPTMKSRAPCRPDTGRLRHRSNEHQYRIWRRCVLYTGRRVQLSWSHSRAVVSPPNTERESAVLHSHECPCRVEHPRSKRRLESRRPRKADVAVNRFGGSTEPGTDMSGPAHFTRTTQQLKVQRIEAHGEKLPACSTTLHRHAHNTRLTKLADL